MGRPAVCFKFRERLLRHRAAGARTAAGGGGGVIGRRRRPHRRSGVGCRL